MNNTQLERNKKELQKIRDSLKNRKENTAVDVLNKTLFALEELKQRKEQTCRTCYYHQGGTCVNPRGILGACQDEYCSCWTKKKKER